MDEQGNPIFPFAPKKYSSKHNNDQKILYLLSEARDLDTTGNKKHTALSYCLQAMLARSRFGMDCLNQYAGMYWYGGRYPLKEELEAVNPWELKDRQAIVLAGGQIRTVQLPKQWDVLSLLRVTVDDYGQGGLADQAQYTIGL